MAYNKLSIIALACIILLACRKLPPCEEFSTVCTVTYPNKTGVFSKSTPLRIRAEIPYRATNSDGIAVDISRFPPKGFPFGFGKVTDDSGTAARVVYDSIKVTPIRGRFKNWRESDISTQLFMDFGRTDTSFICEFDILFGVRGVMNLLVPGWSFDNNSCSGGFRIKHALNSRNYNFFYEVKGYEWPIHPMEDLNPQFIKIVP